MPMPVRASSGSIWALPWSSSECPGHGGGPGRLCDPGTNRVLGIAEIGFAVCDGATRLTHLYQHSPLRVLFPGAEPSEVVLAVLVTTSGGLVAGDRLEIQVRLQPGAAAHVTASAAEKIYRSPKTGGGATTRIAQCLSIGSGGWLEYLPPETILFDGVRLRRQTRLQLGNGAGFLGGSIIVFGRRARGEAFTHGLFSDRLEVWRNGALVWGDALRIGEDVAAVMADPACFAGAAACATLILAPPGGNPQRFLEAAREIQQASALSGLRAGVTAVNGMLVARWLGRDPLALRRAYAELACHLRAAAMGLPARLPRPWDT